MVDERFQILTVKHRQTLARVEDKGDPSLGELHGMRHHTVTSVGRHNANSDVVRILDGVQMRHIHGARMERRDLIVIEVGGNEGLGGEMFIHLADVATSHAL